MSDPQNMSDAEREIRARNAADVQLESEREGGPKPGDVEAQKKLDAEQQAAAKDAEKDAKKSRSRSRSASDRAKRDAARANDEDRGDDKPTVFAGFAGGANVVSVQDVRRQQIAESQAQAATNRKDEVTNPVYLDISGNEVDPNGNPVGKESLEAEIAKAERNVQEMRQRLDAQRGASERR